MSTDSYVHMALVSRNVMSPWCPCKASKHVFIEKRVIREPFLWNKSCSCGIASWLRNFCNLVYVYFSFAFTLSQRWICFNLILNEYKCYKSAYQACYSLDGTLLQEVNRRTHRTVIKNLGVLLLLLLWFSFHISPYPSSVLASSSQWC